MFVNVFIRSCLVVLFMMPSAHGNPSFRVGVADGPGGFLEISGGELTGSLADLYECVFTRTGLDVEFVSVPLKRGLYYLNQGVLDALMPLARTPDRDQEADFAGELFSAEYVFVTTKPILPITGKRGLRYGTLRGFVGKIFVTDPAANVEEVSKWLQLLPMLQLDRIDVAVMPSLLADSLLEGWDAEVYVQDAGRLPISMYLSGNPRQPERVEDVEAAVRDCRQSE